MIFLLANIVFASLFGLCLKWLQNRQKEDITNVGMINYIAAAIICYFEFREVPNELITANGIGTGATMGLAYFIAFFFVIYAIKYIGVANSTVVGILSICVPILVGVVKWNEQPNMFQWFGIAMSFMALSLIGKKGDAVQQGTVPDKPWFTPWIVVGFFVLCGMSRLAQEAFRHLCVEDERPVYLMSAFSISAIPALLILIFRRKRITLNELLIGTALGTANMLQTHFILKSLKLYDGFIVFPLTSAGGLMLVTLVATQFMGEKLGKLTYIGIGFACLAMVLLNWV